jgi:MFS family permease
MMFARPNQPFLFADPSDFAATNEAHGDEPATELLAEAVSVVQVNTVETASTTSTRRAASSRAHTLASASTSNPGRTLSIATSGTLLVLAVFSAFVVTVGDTARSLQAGVAGEAWALSGMSLGLATALLTAGALADNVGHRRVLMGSAGLFAAASVVAALAPSMAVLVAARVLQGVAGGGVLAASLGSIGRAFPSGSGRTRATGVWGAAVGAGIAVGPLAGAGLAVALGWRSGFWFEAAAAGALMTGAATLPQTPPTQRHPLDFSGVATLGAGMALLTAALVEARRSWSSTTTIALLAAAALLLGAFAAVELTRRGPLLDPRLFAQPQFLASITGALFTGLAVIGLMSYSPALMQRALHLSALGSATVLAAWSATSVLVALAARSIPGRVGTQTRLAIGLAIVAAGEAALTGLGTGSSWTRLLPGLLVAGVGSGIANAALDRIAVESVPPDRVGMGSGANNTARYLGGAAGVALVVTLASGAGENGLTRGWNTAALVSAGLCALGALVVASCRAR